MQPRPFYCAIRKAPRASHLHTHTQYACGTRVGPLRNFCRIRSVPAAVFWAAKNPPSCVHDTAALCTRERRRVYFNRQEFAKFLVDLVRATPATEAESRTASVAGVA